MSITWISPTMSAFDFVDQEQTFGLLIALMLLTLLVARDMSAATHQDQGRRWNAALDVAIVPLGLSFVAIAVTRVADVLA